MGGAHRRAFLGTVVEVTADRPETLVWLDEATAPWLEPSDAQPDFFVQLRHEPDEFNALKRGLAAQSTRRASWFALDRRVVELDTLSSDDTHTAFDERFRCVYKVTNQRVEVIADDSDRHRVGAMRVIRELVTSRARARGDVWEMHASCAEIDGRALVIAGPKHAGKTTLLTALIKWQGAKWISNDRLLVWRSGDRTLARGAPTIVSVRPGTLRRFTELCSAMPRDELTSHLSLLEASRACAEGLAGIETRLRMTSAMFSKQLSTSASAQRPLLATILPILDPSTESFELRPLPAASQRGRLAAAEHGAGLADRHTILSDRRHTRPNGAHPLCSAPVFECRVGPKVLQESGLCALVAALRSRLSL